MKLSMNVDHAGGTVEWETSSPWQVDGALTAFRAFAGTGDADTEIELPTRDGIGAVVRAGDIDRIDLTWEA